MHLDDQARGGGVKGRGGQFQHTTYNNILRMGQQAYLKSVKSSVVVVPMCSLIRRLPILEVSLLYYPSTTKPLAYCRSPQG